MDETRESGRAPLQEHATTSKTARAPGPGTVLADRYRLVEPVGSGGMGTVWRGEHLQLHTPVAIKLISPALLDDAQTRERFVREARAAAALRSPHVVQIFDYGVDEGTPYIAMEFLEGESLAQRLRREGALTPRSTARVLTPVFSAIARAHDAGVVHRDLKPDNIFLVDEDGTEIAKVVDFGVAKGLGEIRLGTTTNTGMILGTPYYMSPEQLMRSGTVDTRVDLWSIAVIAYECLVGQHPFRAETLGELTVAVLVEPPPVPSQHADVPPGFDAWFARATERDPDRRFDDARQMCDALERILRGEGEATIPALATPVPPRPGRAWVPLAAVVVVLAGLGIGLALRPTASGPETPAGTEPTPPAAPPAPIAAPTATTPPAEPPPAQGDDLPGPAATSVPEPASPAAPSPRTTSPSPVAPAEAPPLAPEPAEPEPEPRSRPARNKPDPSQTKATPGFDIDDLEY